jgi:hypothetical protein
MRAIPRLGLTWPGAGAVAKTCDGSLCERAVMASQIGHRAGGVVGLTRPFVPCVTHQVGVVALHMNAGCGTEPLAERTGEISGWRDFIGARRMILRAA